MSDLSFELVGWIPSTYGDEEIRATMGSLRIAAGEDLRVSITEVDDTIGQTVRSHINVPLVSVATWLLMNWWRLRWEGRPAEPTSEWRRAHCLSGIGGDDAWPALEFSSDGDSIQLHIEAETRPNVSAIRYLRNVMLEVPAEKFEAAVERFVDVVEARLAALLPHYSALSELRAELAEERRLSSAANVCRWQALAGINPGEAPEAWIKAAQALVEEAGPRAGDEIMSVLSEFSDGLRSAAHVVDAMKMSPTAVDLSWVSPATAPAPRELPWQKGARLAKELRKRHHLGTGPLSNDALSGLLSVHVPLPGQPTKNIPLSGGFRNGVASGRTKIIWSSSRLANQRFFLARMIGAALVLGPDEHIVPVTNRYSALQKVERAFAQEFLCPWAALDAFTNEHGLDDDALVEAAEHFQVSEWTVRSTLVNRGKISRDRLPPAA
ncbi:MAG: hypothetical protein HUU21_21250 [Polyangiaceae bacterium]|nr:hypothetical protein [Polyangiaceae bacterium]